MLRIGALALAALFAGMGFADDLPLLGLAHVGIRVSDLTKARAFYGGLIGLEEAFTTTKDDGSVFCAYFKINDHQFIEIFRARSGPGCSHDAHRHVHRHTGEPAPGDD